jgi:iron complex outermembrane receptor protein
MTNNDGTFVLNSSGKTILTFSHSGYKTIEIKSDGTSQLPLKWKRKENKLDDVIVVGYGTRRQKDCTGSVASINNKDFNQGVVLTPQQSIQGKLAGS